MIQVELKQKGLAQEIREVGIKGGLSEIGFASAENFKSALRELEDSKAKGYSGGMNFTYRNPKRSTSPRNTLPSANSLIVGAYSYGEAAHAKNSSSVENSKTLKIANYAKEDYYEQLRFGLMQIANLLKGYGHKAVIVLDDNALSDRAAAYRAGIGWQGKNSNIIIPQKGSWFVLGTVITDADFSQEFDKEPQAEECGSCRKCIKECPTGAILPGNRIDARKCLAWLLQKEGVFPIEYRVALKNRIYGCDDCQTSCPKNYPGNQDPEFVALATKDIDSDEPTVFEILDLTEVELLERFGKWYIPNRDPNYIKRNALIILGNICSHEDLKARGVLEKYLKSENPILRAHAVWAAKRIGHFALLDALEGETDTIVLEELRQPVLK